MGKRRHLASRNLASLSEASDLLITGIGSASTIFHLMKYLNRHEVSEIVQVGIAGSFHQTISIGTIVEVVEDRFADLGIADHDQFSTLFEAGLADPNEFPYQDGALYSEQEPLAGLPTVKGITVNTASGTQETINRFIEKYRADIETMEGAAAFYVGKMLNIPFRQIRSVSNFIEPRNTSEWNIPQATRSLSEWMEQMFL